MKGSSAKLRGKTYAGLPTFRLQPLPMLQPSIWYPKHTINKDYIWKTLLNISRLVISTKGSSKLGFRLGSPVHFIESVASGPSILLWKPAFLLFFYQRI